MTIEIETDLLLVWLRAESGGDTQALVDAEPFWHPVGDARLVTLIDYLKAVGMVHNTELYASGTACSLTARGLAVADRLIAERDNPRMRFDRALNGLVAAGMDNYPSGRVEAIDFLLSKHMAVLDEILEVAEVFRAVEYLEANKILTVDQTPQTIRAFTLTALGIECGFKDPISVRKFLNEQQRPGIHNEWNITVNGGAPQMGQDNTQNNVFGYDPQQLALFAREVLAAAQSAEMSEEVRAVVVADAEALAAELAMGAPEPGRVRQLTERVLQSARTNLPALGWTGVAQLVSASLGIPLF
ncbi:hypothetical protein EDD96_1271 [Streptomyces sp. Ag109_G2-6]|uniref:hypothetical protein n=1 Tax=Streptomyces TaxID=1883 RepID=UPI0009A4DA30|nr:MULTISPECIES: hypothetical protein [Streptomyces]RPF44733.1 hypothetical protein EDD96_1271 [Streptomyces sp. Ag109_G2-6]